MQAARFCVSALSRVRSFPTSIVLPKSFTQFGVASLHLSRVNFFPLNKHTGEWTEPTFWPSQNDIIYPPQEIGEPRRPAWVCHMRTQIKYSQKKLYYVAILIRGLSIDEAIKQLSFLETKGSKIVKEILLEAQELAVKEHNVEYKSNLWVAESFTVKGVLVKGLRRHARKRWGRIDYNYCHYFVRLEEGDPPLHYYKAPLDGNEKLKQWLEDRRSREIRSSL